jgi:hypothetical protein
MADKFGRQISDADFAPCQFACHTPAAALYTRCLTVVGRQQLTATRLASVRHQATSRSISNTSACSPLPVPRRSKAGVSCHCCQRPPDEVMTPCAAAAVTAAACQLVGCSAGRGCHSSDAERRRSTAATTTTKNRSTSDRSRIVSTDVLTRIGLTFGYSKSCNTTQ